MIRNVCLKISSNKHPNPRCNFLFNRPAYNHDHPRFFKIGQCLLTLLRHKFQQISAGTKLRPQPFKSHSRIDMPGPPRSGFLTIPQVQSEGREHTQTTRQKQWQMMIWDDIGVSKLGTPNGNGSSTWSQIIRTPNFETPPTSNNAFPVNQLPECFPCFSSNPRRFPGAWVCKTSLATSQTKGCPRSKNQQLATHPTNLSCSKVGLEQPLTCQLGVPASISCLEVGLLFVTETRCGME